jgi:tetratricopeptide (TPR) repeat protein
VLLAQKKLKQAEEQFQRALALRPDYEDAHVNHAAVLNLEKRGGEAIPELQKVLQANPKNLKAHANLAATYFDLHRYGEASDSFALTVELSPNDPDMRANLGLALQKAGKGEESRKAYAEARRLRTPPTKN